MRRVGNSVRGATEMLEDVRTVKRPECEGHGQLLSVVLIQEHLVARNRNSFKKREGGFVEKTQLCVVATLLTPTSQFLPASFQSERWPISAGRPFQVPTQVSTHRLWGSLALSCLSFLLPPGL